MFGWRGRILRVDLLSGLIRTEVLKREEVKNYLGGRGLGAYLHTKDVPVSTPPLDSGNHLIFATGPLTGTLAPNGGRFTVVTRTVPDGELATASISGKWGPELKGSGFDAIVFEGRAAEPVYLWVNDRKAVMRPAVGLRGKTVSETVALLRSETDAAAVVCCIGPAAENGVSCSVIVSNGFSASGENGAGAVMGSKNLKAVVISGTQGFRMANQERFLKAAMDLRSFMKARSISLRGTRVHDPVLEAENLQWDGADQESRAARTRGCFGCATSFSWFNSHDGRLLQLTAGNPPVELSERLREFRLFVDLGLDYLAAKSALVGQPEASHRELAGKIASGELPFGGGNKDCRSVDRSPCFADGYAIYPRVAEGGDLMPILESAGLCPFLGAGIGMDTIAELLTAATGIEFSGQDLLQVGKRISDLKGIRNP